MVSTTRFVPQRRRARTGSLSLSYCGPGESLVCEPAGSTPQTPGAVCRCVGRSTRAGRCEPPCKRGQICRSDGSNPPKYTCVTLFTDEPQDPLGDAPAVQMMLAQPAVNDAIMWAANAPWAQAKQALVRAIPRFAGCSAAEAWANLDDARETFAAMYGRYPQGFDEMRLLYRGAAKLCGAQPARRPVRRVARLRRR